MLEIAAMVLFVLWVMGLISGASTGGAIHVLLAASLIAFGLHLRSGLRSRSMAVVTPAGMLALVVGRSGTARKRDVPAAPSNLRA